MKDKPIWVSGGTGYVGGRLIPRLLEAGYKVRAISRSVDKLSGRVWSNHPNLEIYPADVMDLETLTQTLRGCSVAYYLVHSMNESEKNFEEADRKAAKNMIRVAEQVGLERIIYLGGLGQPNSQLSKHLRSRHEVAEILQSGKVPVTIFRAAMIIGSGSASFEIMRYLVDRLPVMITPKWVNTPSQPIAIRNVLHYLISSIEKPETIGKSFDIGGPEVVTYRDLMELYAQIAGLPKRVIFSFPFMTPGLSSYWINIITPISASLARPLAEGLRNPVVCENDEIKRIIPQQLFTPKEAIELALKRVEMQQVESHWSDAGYSYPPEWVYYGDPQWSGGTIFEDKRKVLIESSLEDIWDVIVRIGGETGWYYGNWMWKLRGFLDKLIGGVGLRRGRRHASELRPGDALDFWRVVDIKKESRLLLVAEMKLPGEAVLDFRLLQIAPGIIELQQIARFLPRGLMGLLYWWAVTPLHYFVFNGMLKGIADASSKKIISGPGGF
jgi:uncharacterized protein YbjT (DUF2867 family)